MKNRGALGMSFYTLKVEGIMGKKNNNFRYSEYPGSQILIKYCCMKHWKYLFLIFFISCVYQLSAINQHKIDSLRKVLPHSRDTSLLSIYLKIAHEYEVSHYDSSLKYILSAEEIAKAGNFKEGYAKALLLHGSVLHNKGDHVQALESFNHSLSLSQEIHNELLLANSYERIASVNISLGNGGLALRYYYKSLLLFEKLENKKGIAKVYSMIGVYKSDIGESDSALIYLRKSLQVNTQLHDRYNIIENKINMGYVYAYMNENEKAEKIFKESIPDILDLDYDIALSVVYSNLAAIKLRIGDYDSSLFYFDRSNKIAKKISYVDILADNYLHISKILFRSEKNYDSALKLVDVAIQYAKKIGNLKQNINALCFGVEIDSTLGNIKEAFVRQNTLIELKDSLNSRKLKHNMEKIEMAYKNQKANSKIAVQSKIIDSYRKIKKLYLILLILSIIVIALLVLLAIIGRYSNKKNKLVHQQQMRLMQLEVEKSKEKEISQQAEKTRIENELKSKERELVSTALQMEQSKEALKLIQHQIKELLQKNPPNEAKLRKVDRNIQLKIKEFDNWDMFYRTFNEIHKDFFKKLKEKHPNLTKTELKYCTFIRIRISSKQIASILNVSMEAVRKTRYRIRKKMDLHSKSSLEDYLMKF